jgi:hypothetical protein
MKAFFKKLNFSPFELTEAIVSDLINVYEKISFNIKRITGKYNFLKKNKLLKEINKNKRIFLLGNGPSLNDFDLKKLNNEIVIMVNRSFDHPDYEIIKPKYHIFIDPKLATGEWPIEYLETVYKKNPDVTLLLNAKWYHLKKFSNYRNKKNVYWIINNCTSLLYDNFNVDLSTIYNSGVAVVDQGIALAIYSGSKKIYILGVELNGIAYLMAGHNSHFSGKDPDYKDFNCLSYSKSMNASSRSIRQFIRFSINCRKRNIELINLSNRGLLDFIEKENFNKLFVN